MSKPAACSAIRGHTNVICREMKLQTVAGTCAVPCHHSSVVAAEKNIKSTNQTHYTSWHYYYDFRLAFDSL
jgi:hypothetical protein